MATVSWSPVAMAAVAAIVGGAVGAAIAWMAARARAARDVTHSAGEVARLTALLDAERRHAQERETLVRQSEAQLKEAFRALSS
ncbi:MAG TPA: hypothetical protein VFV33_15795, partial [Gemmatimonadaceae bacterium]|nr:hypothetical protein [Gemmatimonadaceae bacterium]